MHATEHSLKDLLTFSNRQPKDYELILIAAAAVAVMRQAEERSQDMSGPGRLFLAYREDCNLCDFFHVDLVCVKSPSCPWVYPSMAELISLRYASTYSLDRSLSSSVFVSAPSAVPSS
jgi:hypothetical protein